MLKYTKISFPGIFPNLEMNINSVAFELFGHQFPWYALIITSAIIFCFIYVTLKVKKFGIIPDTVMDIGMVTVICGILGARIYYVATSWSNYKDNLWDIFKIWEGGIAIYGALIGGGLGVLLMCRHKKISFRLFGDCVAPSLLMAQAIGRWGNFFNAEAHGSETSNFLRMGLQRAWESAPTYYHPTFLYESIWNTIGFVLASYLAKKHRRYDGFMLLFVFAWYGLGRMFIELLRTDSLYISSHHAWYTKISVLVGFGFFVGCTTAMIYIATKMKQGKAYQLTLPIENTPVECEEN